MSSVGSKSKYSEFSSATRNTLKSVKLRSVTAGRDNEPLTLIDRLKSTPADPVEMLSSTIQQQQPTYQARYLYTSQQICFNL